MADDDRGKDAPSLEPPSLGFRRKRRQEPAQSIPTTDTAIADTPADDSPTAIVETDEPAPVERPVVLPVAEPVPPLFADEVETPPRPVSGATDSEQAPRTLSIGGRPAAILTGLLVGVITVGLTSASLRLCEVAKGTSSCGGPGFLLLVAILIAMVLLGTTLLKACRVPDPGSTSFLAVGLLAVLSLLFLLDVIFNWWMILVIPVFSMLTFAASHWVTTAIVESPND